MSTGIRKIEHRDRKHFVVRDHGSYLWGNGERQKEGNRIYPRYYGNYGNRGTGAKRHDHRTLREIQNADDRRLLQMDF
jgi:hypothetical protein